MDTYTSSKQVFVLPLGLTLKQLPIFFISFSRDPSPIPVTKTTIRGSSLETTIQDQTKAWPFVPVSPAVVCWSLFSFYITKNMNMALECTQNFFIVAMKWPTFTSPCDKKRSCCAYSFEIFLKGAIKPAQLPPPKKKPKWLKIKQNRASCIGFVCHFQLLHSSLSSLVDLVSPLPPGTATLHSAVS